MSGILDSHVRVMDTILTQQGRRQLTNGSLRISYVSFSDCASFYQHDALSGSSDASSRVYLEATGLPQDMITYEADDSGKLLPFTFSSGSFYEDRVISAGQILSGSSTNGFSTVVDDTFSSESELIPLASLQNFKNLMLIGSNDELMDDGEQQFSLSRQMMTMNVYDDRPIQDPTRHVTNINEHESLFLDPRMSRLPNFKFLPPLNQDLIGQGSMKLLKSDSIVSSTRHKGAGPTESWKKTTKQKSMGLTKIESVPKGSFLGSYSPLGSMSPLSDLEVMRGLQYFDKKGYRVNVEFTPRPRSNNVVCQIFERNKCQMRKLDILDFGRISLENGRLGSTYFVGKVVTDEHGVSTFIHMFTMVFESYVSTVSKVSQTSKLSFNG